MGDDYMWEYEDNKTITVDLNQDSTWDDIYTVATNNVLSPPILTTGTDSNVYVESDIIMEHGDETIKVLDTMIQQRYEIEALTDVIKEMVTTKNFDVDFDINKRVEQKKFLKKLGEDPNDL